MGSFLSFFSSKRDTKALLEKIQNEIESIEDFKYSSSKREKNCICLLFLTFILLYLVSAVVFYVFYLSPISLKTYNEIVISCLPLIIFPIIFFLLIKSLQYYYRWNADNKEDRLKDLRKQKKKILERVKETENFKNAKEILEKYDPKALFESVSLRTMNACSTPSLNMTPQRTASNDYQLRYRSNTTPMPNSFRPLPALMPSPSSSTQNIRFRPNLMSGQQMRGPVMTPQRMVVMPPPLSTVKPILPQNRSIVEKMVDYMVSDGPSNRYALICMHCYSHNGMALKEEFEYIAYFCCYCKRFNPSRKAKPTAPRLQPLDQSKRNSSAPLIDEPESDTDSERGRIPSEDITPIQEVISNSEEDKQNDVQNERDDQNKELTINNENDHKSDDNTEEVVEQISNLEINNSTSAESNETVEENKDKSIDPNVSDIPFIDDSNL